MLEKDYNELKIHEDKQSVGEILVQRAAKTAIQILYDKELFDSFLKTDEVLEDVLVATRLRPGLEKVNGDVVQ